jgi:hypothetical protein
MKRHCSACRAASPRILVVTVVLLLTALSLCSPGALPASAAGPPPAGPGIGDAQRTFAKAASDTNTLVLQPGPEGKDSYVYSFSPGTNDGNSEWFKGIGLISYSAAFIGFDLSSIPQGSTVISATITLWGAYQNGQIYFRPAAADWDELAITWDNQPGTVGIQASYPISRGDPSGPCYWGCTMDFDITSIVQYWIDNPSLDFGLWVGGDTPGLGWLMAAGDNLSHPRPKLVVMYRVPLGVEPATWGSIKELYR